MNKEAGSGMLLFLKVRLENGEEIPCALDTGAPTSHLSGDVENKLGKRIGRRKFSTLDENGVSERIYASPKLFLGKTRLLTGDCIGAVDGPMGLLGMDCLQHYCIQLDFQARKIRFLDPEKVDSENSGTAFPLMDCRYATVRRSGLFGQDSSALLIDTGCAFDAYLKPRQFHRLVKERRAQTIPMLKDGLVQTVAPGFALFPQCEWEGGKYTNLIVGTGPNLIGLRFLARHEVTFNFPKSVMYLKQTSIGPLAK